MIGILPAADRRMYRSPRPDRPPTAAIDERLAVLPRPSPTRYPPRLARRLAGGRASEDAVDRDDPGDRRDLPRVVGRRRVRSLRGDDRVRGGDADAGGSPTCRTTSATPSAAPRRASGSACRGPPPTAGSPPAPSSRRSSSAIVAAQVVALPLMIRGGWPIVADQRVVDDAAAVAYMGGPRPIAYTPFGELTVFVFFGLVAVCGTYYVQAGDDRRRGGDRRRGDRHARQRGPAGQQLPRSRARRGDRPADADRRPLRTGGAGGSTGLLVAGAVRAGAGACTHDRQPRRTRCPLPPCPGRCACGAPSRTRRPGPRENALLFRDGDARGRVRGAARGRGALRALALTSLR